MFFFCYWLADYTNIFGILGWDITGDKLETAI